MLVSRLAAFSPFPMFSKVLFPWVINSLYCPVKGYVFTRGLNSNLLNFLPQLLMTLQKMAIENISRKEQNAGNQHFLLFPQCFLPYQRVKSFFQQNLFCCLQMQFGLL